MSQGTDFAVDIRVAQLLCSRLCHDLIGPAGAVNAGLEILAESADAEATVLVAESADQVTKRLSFYRVAFGAGTGTGETAAQARDLAMGLLHKGRYILDWPPLEGSVGSALAAGGARLILNMVLIAIDCLPRGGNISVNIAGLPEGTGVALTASGLGAGIRDDIRQAMAPEATIGDLTARNVHGYFAKALAKRLGCVMEVSENQSEKVNFATLILNME